MLRTRRLFLSLPLAAFLAACARPLAGARTATPVESSRTVPPAPSPAAATPTARATAEATAQPLALPTARPTVEAATVDFPGNSLVKILFDTAGYVPNGPRTITLQAPKDITLPDSSILNLAGSDGTPLLSATLKGPLTEPEGGPDRAWLADLSGLQKPGRYQLRFGKADTPPLILAPDAYAQTYVDALRSYYLNRCGMAIADSVTGVHHAVCHHAPAVLESNRSSSLTVTGGWHDAGDYGRYLPTAAVTTAQLLLLAELVPGARQSVPGTDLVSEVRYELDWMLKMQRADGAVYHKVTTENFPGFIMPEDDTAPELIYGVGSRSTGLFAAATARAARYFKNGDPTYADKLAGAARKAWAWLEKNPGHIVPPVGNTGAYLTDSDADARAWAAAELFALTGDSSYEAAYQKGQLSSLQPPSWDDVNDLAVLTYARTPGGDSGLHKDAVGAILELATSRAAYAAKHPYGVGLYQSDYHWASAKLALAIGEHLILANQLQPDPSFLDAAAAQLHWVLGRNPLGRSFVTGRGANAPEHPHHRLVAAGGKMIPGMLVGGPNNAGEDGICPAGRGPRSYIDSQQAYSCNEPAIDYNAPLVFVAGYLANVK
ncbi:MAG TPA: glycoside hydrolase family 9 protein [Chloroflexota bacterium]|nr:glycoside hydrolase family 9 protein [Chloroflexota bacterium]